MKPVNKKETTTKEIAQNVFMHTSKMALKNTEDLAHTLYTYTVSTTTIGFLSNVKYILCHSKSERRSYPFSESLMMFRLMSKRSAWWRSV